MMSRARDLFSSSRVRALGEQRGRGSSKHRTPASVHTHEQAAYLTESCMVLQMCNMALRMTGSLVSSTWFLQKSFL